MVYFPTFTIVYHLEQPNVDKYTYRTWMVWDTDLICWSVGHDDSDDRDFNPIKGVLYYQHVSQREVYVFQRVFSSHGNSQDQKNTFKIRKSKSIQPAKKIRHLHSKVGSAVLNASTFHRSANGQGNITWDLRF